MAKYQYQTEVGQLLKLMTHSLYSNREIFLRELISNASDALDKFNYLHITDDNFKNEKWEPQIIIKIDKKDKSLSVIDNGIGMNEQDLIDNLGTIAKSGTKAFMQQLEKNKNGKIDSNLIGQFGVGFYSVFMVSQNANVATKKAGDTKAYKFISDGSGEFEVSSIIKDEHGTVVHVKLNDDASEFLEVYKIKEIIKKYSNHIPYKIYIDYEETITHDDKEKIEHKNELANEATALWTLPKSEIKEDEYKEFYKSTWGDFEEPLFWLHNNVEGTQEYKTLFYIPKVAPADIYRADFESGIKLYIKRVFITDKEKELLPLYLRFVRGIIDSEDLPLNISREILQENKILANIKQSSVKKILNAIKKLDSEKFDAFISQYNKLIKEGIFMDHLNKDTLLEIVRYKSSVVDNLTSLASYIEREKDKEGREKEIYYLIGENENILKNSPLLESYKKSNLEVLIMDEKELDEVVTPAIGEYKEWKLVDITMVEPPKNKDDQKELDAMSKEYDGLVGKIKDILGDSVKDVKITTRLVDSPSCVVPDSSDPMAGMRHMFAQMGQEAPELPLILELNAKHELIKKVNSISDEQTLKDSAWLLLDSAKLAEGLEPTAKTDFAKRVTSMLTNAL